jgi:hypothetical protein
MMHCFLHYGTADKRLLAGDRKHVGIPDFEPQPAATSGCSLPRAATFTGSSSLFGAFS